MEKYTCFGGVEATEEDLSLTSWKFKEITELTIEGQVFKKTVCSIFETFILLEAENNIQKYAIKIPFHFDLLFDITLSKPNHVTGDSYSYISFQERLNELFVKFQDKDGNKAAAWKSFLITKLNYKGFHHEFKAIKELGSGNFASVYLVSKNDNNKLYAVKAFFKEDSFKQKFGKETIMKEIEIMRQLDHPNLMKIYGVYETRNSIYIQIELLKGGQLYDKIKNKYRFTVSEIKKIMKSILTGIQTMHQKNYIHRDIKPENILLREENDFDCVIADFGLSDVAETDKRLFVRCGTPGYVAPQVINAKSNKTVYGRSCDMFSAGVIFHILLLGKSPFDGKSYDQVYTQNKVCKFNFQSEEYTKLPKIWLNLLKALLNKNPVERITAQKALAHDYFHMDTNLREESSEGLERSGHSNSKQFRISSSQQKPKPHHRLSLNNNPPPPNAPPTRNLSPLMITKDMSRKVPAVLNSDSSSSFVMKENVPTVKAEEGKEIQKIESPVFIQQKKRRTQQQQSRFRRLRESHQTHDQHQ